ncbi:diguanylate cyclase, PAS domain-containing [Syntrophotalea carbinolica DSM 2380]|uniref:diguanylate cyclase n=1 Tax=Syntrophotalea carbinolica (strain DSM 2380 / NBRC 103641 / GraBd1) TaxID=338963 RepID=Q3A1L9_SYNC1|nr:diguanylate cyclase, PAS domain-containing [Syntrophotalea carbinolica DSM 2380]
MEATLTNPETLLSLEERIRELEIENKSLAETCHNLATSQKKLEELVAASTKKQLAMEMQSMELEQIFSSSSDPIWVVRQDGTIVRANSAMLRLLNRTHDAVVGHACHDVFDFCSRDSARCPLTQAHLPQSFHEWDIECPNAKGESDFYMVSTASLVTLDGSPGIVGHFRDITIRKRAEAALEQANTALSHLARVDALTQIPNRRAFDEALQAEWGRLAREEGPLSLVLCDIDCFKKYNDHYGHQAGDKVLRRVAEALADCARRPADLASRYGGEEFALLLPQTPLEGALSVAEKARQAVEDLALQHPTSSVKPILTLSLGVASVIPSLHIAPTTLIESADKALYQAKNADRNRVVPAVCSSPTSLNL